MAGEMQMVTTMSAKNKLKIFTRLLKFILKQLGKMCTDIRNILSFCLYKMMQEAAMDRFQFLFCMLHALTDLWEVEGRNTTEAGDKTSK